MYSVRQSLCTVRDCSPKRFSSDIRYYPICEHVNVFNCLRCRTFQFNSYVVFFDYDVEYQGGRWFKNVEETPIATSLSTHQQGVRPGGLVSMWVVLHSSGSRTILLHLMFCLDYGLRWRPRLAQWHVHWRFILQTGGHRGILDAVNLGPFVGVDWICDRPSIIAVVVLTRTWKESNQSYQDFDELTWKVSVATQLMLRSHVEWWSSDQSRFTDIIQTIDENS